jgi:hypothetical protein
MLKRLKRLALDPFPMRRTSLRIIRRFVRDDFDFKYRHGILERPHYAYIMFEGAKLAKSLGHSKISVIEFGVAGGAGLLAMERLADEIEKRIDIEFEIYGFDTGTGLPPPQDYRDLPYQWREGFFAMDVPSLKGRLKRAKLVIGDVKGTSQTFFSEFRPAPIAAVSHDFDYYSSTMDALKMFDRGPKRFLPRTFCYFDDIIGDSTALYNEYTGQLGAINDFNKANSMRKLCQVSYLLSDPIRQQWHHQIYAYHQFDHPDYCRFVAMENQQLPLGASSPE